MKKAIHVDSTGKVVERVLSIADVSIVNANPTGLPYIVIENYVEKPEVLDPALDIAYPMYNKETGEFFWMVVNYQMTVADYILDIKNMEHEISILRTESVTLKAENESLREVTDALLLESLETEIEESEVV